MFERFTDRARRVLVTAQEESKRLGHSFLGTEHLLLALVHEPEAVSAQVLASFGVTSEAVRARVEAIVPPGSGSTASPPFTPRAKKVLELSLREALQLGHNYIGTEHMLLGALREGEGIAAQVLFGFGVDLVETRSRVGTIGEVRGPARGPGHLRGGPYAEVDGRSAADYAKGFEALAEMLAEEGGDLAEVAPETIRISGIEREHVRGLQIAVVKGHVPRNFPNPLPAPAAVPLEQEDPPRG